MTRCSHNREEDPFASPHALFEEEADFARRIYGQLITYVKHHHDAQPRVCSFHLCLFGDQARIIRWDRTGALVTELFSWTQGTISYNFFSHFNEASVKQRGVDTTVRPASLEEVNKAKAAFKRAGFGDTNSMTRPHYLYQVPTQTPPAPNPSYAPFGSFLARRPSVWSHSFTGRASAVYICWDGCCDWQCPFYEGCLA